MSEPTPVTTTDLARRHLAHEIRNSLGAMRSAAELLHRRYQPEGRELRLFEVIIKEIDRLVELTKAELGKK
jgi:nitrogen-specific signal transduction histidine kinase